VGNRSIERYYEEVRSYFLTTLNKVLVDARGVREDWITKCSQAYMFSLEHVSCCHCQRQSTAL